MLQHGANPNDCKDMMPPFHRVLVTGQPADVVRLMLEFNADCKIRSTYDSNAVDWCGAWGEDPEILRLLLAHGGDVNARDEYGEAAIHRLMWQRPLPLPLLEEFLRNGANVNITDKEGQQPLYEVCTMGSVDGCRILLDHGADIENADQSGITALHTVAQNGHSECVKLLVERGASLWKVDKHSRSPFWYASSNGFKECTQLLLEATHQQGRHEIISLAATDGRTPFSKTCGG